MKLSVQPLPAKRWSRRDLLRASGGVAALGAASLTGCSALTPDSSDNDDNEGGPVTFTTSDQEPEGPFLDAYNEMTAIYRDRFPDWKHDPHPRESPSVLVQTLPAKLANGSLETAFMLPSASVGVPMRLGQLADATDWLTSWEHFDELEQVYLDAATLDGRIFGHGYTGGYFGMVINRKMFAAAGLDPDNPPTTWEAFEEAARALSKPDDDIYGYGVLNDIGGAWHYLGWVYAAGGRVMKENSDGLWTATVDEGPAQQALEMYQRMRWQDRSLAPKLYAAPSDMSQDMVAGKLGMMIGQANAISAVLNQEGFETEVGDIGLGPLPQNGQDFGTLAQASVYVYSAKASEAQVEAAAQWTLLRTFDPEAVDAYYASLSDAGVPISPVNPRELVLKVDSPLRQELAALSEKYTDIPMELLAPFVESGGRLEQVDEPPYGPQEFYTFMVPVFQAVLTEENTDVAERIAEVNEQVQTAVLDPVQ